jgi:uncharacterized SAM-binding protein YcdF (DUF218 family)
MFDKLLIALISPLGTALVLGGLALLLARGSCRRWATGLGVLALVWLWGWSLPVVSQALLAAVEADHPVVPVQDLPHAQAIVVLGGSVTPPERAGQLPDLTATADRVWHGARLFHAGKAPLLVLTGGSNPAVSITSEAEAMRLLLSDLGVPAGVTLLEERSRNTRENARYTADLLQPRGVSRILLVTSALHMRRAAGLFEAQGFTVIAAATDHEARSRFDWTDWLPTADALDGSGRAMKELLGRAAGR